MKTIDRYIGARLAFGFLLVALILSSLFSLLEIVKELDDIGTGQYHARDAFAFVALTLPGRFLDLVPVGALLGSILALGSLAGGGELLAMQTAGIPVSRIGKSVLGAGAFLMLGAVVLAEFVVPPMEQYAQTRRSIALADLGTLKTEHGFWAREGLRFIHIRRILPGGIPADLDIFEFDERGRLTTLTHASRADIRDRRRWLLFDVEVKEMGDRGLVTRRIASRAWDSFLTASQVNVLGLPPRALSLTDLYRYVRALRRQRQNAAPYELALWQKGCLPLTTGAMVLLSLPFAFGPLRSMSAGRRIMLGSIVGIAFFLANQIGGYLGLLFELNPAIPTLAPVAAVLLAAWRLSRRVS